VWPVASWRIRIARARGCGTGVRSNASRPAPDPVYVAPVTNLPPGVNPGSLRRFDQHERDLTIGLGLVVGRSFLYSAVIFGHIPGPLLRGRDACAHRVLGRAVRRHTRRRDCRGRVRNQRRGCCGIANRRGGDPRPWQGPSWSGRREHITGAGDTALRPNGRDARGRASLPAAIRKRPPVSFMRPAVDGVGRLQLEVAGHGADPTAPGSRTSLAQATVTFTG